jgi:hypothetical protein
MSQHLSLLADAIDARAASLPSLHAVAGFDAFVDEMISVVGERRGVGEWTPMASMADLGGVLTRAAGRNGLREIVVRSADAGGCAVNLGDGLASLGVGLHYYGTVGVPRHPAFADFAGKCASCTALGTVYGRSLAFEFGDGKFFFSAVEQLAELSPELLAGALADGAFARACRISGLIVLNNWTCYPHMTACWRLLQREVLAALPHRPYLFLDLVDPSGRGDADIAAMLEAVRGFEGPCRVVFGLNLTEAAVITRILGLPAVAGGLPAMAAGAEAIRSRLGLSEVVIHNRTGNAVAWQGGSAAVEPGPHCAVPRKSTGAGDRFNAGYCLGLLLGLEGRDRLDLGSAMAGFFLRSARSASATELAAFLRSWAAGTLPKGGD